MNPSTKPTTTVTCRPGPIWITCAALLALLGGFFLVGIRLAPRPVDDPAFIIIGIIGLSLASLLVLFCATSRVVADEQGLRWKRFGFGRSVPWSGVLEYHLQDTQGSARKPFLIIQTEAGRLVVPDLWTHQADLKAILLARAIDSLDDEWGVLDPHSKDRCPRLFYYDTRRLQMARFAVVMVLALYFKLFLLPFATKGPRMIEELGTWLWCASLLFALALVASMAALLYCGLVIPLIDGIRRRGERITVDPDGITFEDGQRTIAANWESVLSVQCVPVGRMAYGRKRAIVTPAGEFEYTHVIRDAMRLDAIIKRFAVNARYTADGDDDVIAPKPATLGARVYHYRTRTNRALMMFPLGFVLIACVIAILQVQGLAEHPDPTMPWVMGVGSFAVWAWTFWRYRTVSVRTDSLGITHTGPGGKRFIAWTDVGGFRTAGSDVLQFGVLRGSQSTIRFWLGISNSAALVKEIKFRTGVATGP